MENTSTRAELERRLKQQQLLSQFGVQALRSRDLDALLQTACDVCAEGMETTFAKILRPVEGCSELLVVAGVGWRPGVVGHATISAHMGSPAGFALKTGQPVISNDLKCETRFSTPKLMAEHGIRSAVNVLIEVQGSADAVLEVDSREVGKFEQSDLAFMTGFANLVGVALERHEVVVRLAETQVHQELLTREASHRVKNSLAIVSSLIALRLGKSTDPAVKSALSDVQMRIDAIAQAHDQLWRHPTVGMVAIKEFLSGIIDKLNVQSDLHDLRFESVELDVLADRAIPLGLLITELVTNAMKHAYPDGTGPIRVKTMIEDEQLLLVVSDNGVGLPDGFVMREASSRGLGARMIVSLARQLHGILKTTSDKGTAVSIVMPIGWLQGT